MVGRGESASAPDNFADGRATLAIIAATRRARFMSYFIPLVIDGALAGVLYALIALAFVLVYKASAMMNFALGEWVVFGAVLAGTGLHYFQLGTVGALIFAAIGMIALTAGFYRLVVRRLVARPALSAIMATLGLGMVMRGSGLLVFSGAPSLLPPSLLSEPMVIDGVAISAGKLACGWVARWAGVVAIIVVAQMVTAAGTCHEDWMVAVELADRLGADLGVGSIEDIRAEMAAVSPIHAELGAAPPDGVVFAGTGSTFRVEDSGLAPAAPNSYDFRLVVDRDLYDAAVFTAHSASLSRGRLC